MHIELKNASLTRDRFRKSLVWHSGRHLYIVHLNNERMVIRKHCKRIESLHDFKTTCYQLKQKNIHFATLEIEISTTSLQI